MEAHPVPQNISSFEFHLVGDMTLKQFLYLAIGLGMAYLVFILLAPNLPLLAWPLIFIFVIFGVAFAFLPIMERPLDYWAAAFFKAVFYPTQRSYISKALKKEDPNFRNRLNTYLTVAHIIPEPPKQIIKPPPVPIPVKIVAPVQEATTTRQEIPPLPTAQELKDAVELARQAQNIQSKILETEQRLNQIKVSAATPGVNPQSFTENFQQILSDLQTLNNQATDISQRLALLTKTPTAPQTRTPLNKLKIMPSLTLTSTANIINGIVTDNEGNYLDGAIIVAHDRQGLPVRALKSNKLGQFIAATPLTNGLYTISIEKDDLSFDIAQLELKGTILKPIIVSAKKPERVAM